MSESTPDTRSVFVVHGRNEPARRAMFAFLRSIDLKPIEWSRAVELTEKASPYIGEVLDAAFSNAQAVVVLMTPDEVAYLQPTYGHGDDDTETRPATQARPNVLFEAGMALGRHPNRTVLVELGRVRPFSDVAGRHAVRLSNDSAARQELANRLRIAGCPVDTQGTEWHDTGDFTPPPGPEGQLGRRVPATTAKKPVDFDLRFTDAGPKRLSKLAVINRGTETASKVDLSVPDDAAIDLRHSRRDGELPIEKIPGGGRSVTVMVDPTGLRMGLSGKRAFDITIDCVTESGERYSQDVFLDTNG